jgi:3',5'-cyclic AMP phosphodiesterase CpdA
MAFTIVQVSDTHLGPSRPQYTENWRIVAEAVAALRPDLVINTGDMSKDGADSDDDLIYAKARMDELALPWLAIPGNHDVGDDPVSAEGSSPPQEILPARLERYRRIIGDDWWCRDMAGWRLIGLNTQLCNSDMAAESAQAAFLDEVVTSANGRPIALFVHKPLFARPPAIEDDPHRFLNPPMRQRLEAIIRDNDVRLVASGHLHQAHHMLKDGAERIWAPSTAFIVGETVQPTMGRKELGFVELRFDGASVSHRFHHPDAMTRHAVPGPKAKS